jgi:hypothetical protein
MNVMMNDNFDDSTTLPKIIYNDLDNTNDVILEIISNIY